MFTQKHTPYSLSGEDLDEYLERGWYRMGQSIFTCHFLFFDGNLYSPIWTRISLLDFQFKKTLRRLISSNEKHFRVVIQKAELNTEKEELYQLYRFNFKGTLPLSLDESLNDSNEVNIFNTMESIVYDDDRMVAYSFFDLGKTSISSIKGIYHPDYSSFSLGLYTMLLEMKYGLANGFEYFYPGYVVPGYPRFDYKLRIGSLDKIEYYDVKVKTWLPYNTFTPENSLVKVMMKKLAKVIHHHSLTSMDCEVLFYPAYEANIFGYDLEPYLESPFFINCYRNYFEQPRFIIFYDIWREIYVFCHCLNKEDLNFYLSFSAQFDSRKSSVFQDFLLKKTIIIETADIDELAKWVNLIKGLIELSFYRRPLK